ncbi:unnamed protein product [Prunus brigantina]
MVLLPSPKPKSGQARWHPAHDPSTNKTTNSVDTQACILLNPKSLVLFLRRNQIDGSVVRVAERSRFPGLSITFVLLGLSQSRIPNICFFPCKIKKTMKKKKEQTL